MLTLHLVSNLLVISSILQGIQAASAGGRPSIDQVNLESARTVCQEFRGNLSNATQQQRFGRFNISYQPNESLDGGITATEYFAFMTSIQWPAERNPHKWQWFPEPWNIASLEFTTTKDSRCKQLGCIGNGAVLNICDSRPISLSGGSLNVNLTLDTFIVFLWTAWPSLDPYYGRYDPRFNLVGEIENWVDSGVDTWSCASDYTRKDRRPKSSDRFKGIIYYQGNQDISISIEAGRRIENGFNLTTRGYCDPALSSLPNRFEYSHTPYIAYI